MKIQKLNLESNPLFGNKNIEFINANGNILNMVVFAGNNGSGKTTMLEKIVEILTNTDEKHHKNNYVDICIQSIIDSQLLPGETKTPMMAIQNSFFATVFQSIDEKNRPKIVYMPAEINFDTLSVHEKSYQYAYAFKNIIDKNIIKDVGTYISTLIKDEVFKNLTIPARNSINAICEKINVIFDDLEIDVRLTGLAAEGEKLPIFINSSGHDFDINALSSGEKQLFVRALSIKMLNVNNSIILIDEPEISLHPKWQQKILKTYQKMGQNNQIFVATHSPHILSSVTTDNVFLFSRKKNKSIIYNYKDMNSVYGKPIEIVLKDFMGLESDRNPEIANLINEVRSLVRNEQYETDVFINKFKKLK
ncbi:ATP-binding protein involved in virulence-like protein, partial [Candidatus Magnetomorum sp. HK-1]